MSEPNNLVDCYRCGARVPITATDIDENGYLCNRCVAGNIGNQYLEPGALLTGKIEFEYGTSDYDDDEW